MKNRIKDDVAERISRQIERYKAEKKAVRKFIGPEYLAAGCVSIRFNKSEGLELSYDAKKHETYWHLDKTRVIWAPQDIEMLRKDSR